jgi:hypothetical protein
MKWPGFAFGAAVLLQAAAAVAQPAPSANYTTIDVEPGKVSRIGVYAQGRKDCSLTKAPIVRVVEVPVAGTLTVRPGNIKTASVPNCPDLQVPAQIVLYQGREGASSDRLLYSVTYPNGEIALYDVTIRFKEAVKAN